MSRQIPSAVLGASGYVGGELLRLVSAHPNFNRPVAVSSSIAGEPIAALYPGLLPAFGDARFAAYSDWLDDFAPGGELALFSAAPHGSSAGLLANALEAAQDRQLAVHIVDVSADFRFADRAGYEAIYGVEHGAPALLPEFHCALPEHADGVPATHIAHPGCFATAMLLAAVPLLRSGLIGGEVFVSGTTGSTGSGRTPGAGTHHPERHSNMYAYKPLAHRHSAEVAALAEAASGRPLEVHFVPHSGPFARGIHVCLQAQTARKLATDELLAMFREAYAHAGFVDVVDGTPRLKSVVASNYAQIGVAADGKTLAVMCSIDNLVKGAAGGAVQWMNRLYGLPEDAGLAACAPGWT